MEAYSCIHAHPQWVAKVVIATRTGTCEDCGTFIMSERQFRGWVNRELISAERRVHVIEYDSDNQMTKQWDLDGIVIG